MFFTRVRETYLALAKAEPARMHVIDASRALPQVEQQIAAVLEKLVHGR